MSRRERTLDGRYVLETELGRGGMGVVWRARDTRLRRDVAVKVLHPWVASDADGRRRFSREALALGQLTHPNIVRIYDVGESEDEAYLVMELVDGPSVEQATGSRLPVSWPEACALLAPVGRALGYAHEKDIVHRDLSPSNVLIDRATGRVAVTDFGLARLARSAGGGSVSTQALIGTPEYWSPEQARGREISSASDMYALGCILYRLVTGHLPFEGDDRLAIGLQRLSEEPTPLERWLDAPDAAAVALLDGLLSREPSARPTAKKAAKALSRPDGEPVTVAMQEQTTLWVASPASDATVPIAEPPLPGRSRKRRRLVIGGVLVVMLATVGVAAAVFMWPNPEPSSAGSATVPSTSSTLPESTTPPTIPAEVPVLTPQLIGLRYRPAGTRAKRAADSVGATPPRLVVVGSDYSEKFGPQIVISQRPKAGRAMNGHAAIRVRLSRGSAFATVPDVPPGATLASATSKLGHLGFEPTIRYDTSWNVPEEGVVGLSPPPGTRLRRPGQVAVTLSSGVPTADVPDVTGESVSNAESALTNAGLRSSATYEPAPDSAPGTVLRQSPKSGTVTEGTTVQLVAASQPEWHTILTESGTGPYQSPSLKLPPTARIHYRAGPADNQFGIGNIFVNIDGYLDSFNVDCGKSGIYNLNEPGAHQVQISPGQCTSWWIQVDAFQ